MTRWRRPLILLLALPVLLLGLCAGLLLLAQTERGGAFLARMAARAVPGLAIEGARYHWPNEVRAAELSLQDASGNWLTIAAPLLRFDGRALLRREAHVLEVSAARIDLRRLPQGDDQNSDAAGLPALPALPFAIRLEHLALPEVALGPDLLGQPIRFAAMASGFLDQGRLLLALELARQDAPGQASLHLDLAPGAENLTAALDIDEPPGGVLATALGVASEPTKARLRLEGPARGARLSFTAEIGQAAEARLQGSISLPAQGNSSANLQGEVTAAALWPEALRGALARLDLHLEAERATDGAIALRDLTLTAPLGRLRVAGHLDMARQDLDLTAAAALGPSRIITAQLPYDLHWQGLAAEGRAQGPLLTPRLTLQAGLVDLESSLPLLEAGLGRHPELRLSAMAPDRIEHLTLTGDGARLTMAGRIGSAWDLDLGLTLADLAKFLPDMQGGLAAQAKLSGPRHDPSLRLSAKGERLSHGAETLEAPELSLEVTTPLSAPAAQARLRAIYAGLPVTLDLDGRPEGDRLRVSRLAASLGPAKLDGAGLLDLDQPLFIGALRLDVADLAPLSPLFGQALTGSALLVADFTETGGEQGLKAEINAPDITLAGRAMALQAELAGSASAAHARLDGRYGAFNLSSAANLHASAVGQRLILENLALTHGAERLALAAPAELQRAPTGQITLREVRLTSNRGGQLNASGSWSEEAVDVQARLTALPLGPWVALVAPDLALTGDLAGQMSLHGRAENPDFRLRLETPRLLIGAPAARGLPPLRLRLDANGTAQNIDARAEAIGAGVLRLNATARLGGLAADAPLTGSLTGMLDLGRIAQPLLAAGAQRLNGVANLALTASGPLNTPRLGGQITLNNGAFRDLAHGISLNDIAATLNASAGSFTLARLTAKTPGGGSIQGQGQLDIAASRLPFGVRLVANAARPWQTDLGMAVFDAEIEMNGELLGESRIGGTVLLQRAEIRIPDKLPPTMRSLPGLRETGRLPPGVPALAPPSTTPPPAGLEAIGLALNITAPRAIFLRGRGLDAELGGSVQLTGTLAAPVVEGGLGLRRGNLKLLDRRLELTRAGISFDAGTLMPSLDVAASARAREVDVTVTVEGPARDPSITFSSVPELPPDEVLARLLFDRRGGELSPFQILQLAEALSGATGRSLPGPSGVMDRLRRGLALDRLSIGQEKEGEQRPGEEPGATLEAGRYIADGVFLGLKQSADGGPPRVGVQIDLMPRLRLEAETGGNSLAGDRVGIGFEIEY